MTAKSAASNDPLVVLVASSPDLIEPLRIVAAELGDAAVSLRSVVRTAADRALSQELGGASLAVFAGEILPRVSLAAAEAVGVTRLWVEAGPEPRFDRLVFWPGRLRRALRGFSAIHALDEKAAAQLSKLLPHVPVRATGRLARFRPVRTCDQRSLEALRSVLQGRMVWLAHALPEAELSAVLDAHAYALRTALRLLLVLEPRHPGLESLFAERARARGFEVATRFASEAILPSTQVLVANGGEDSGLYLRLAPVAWLGGSLTSGMGSPPLQPAAALGTALIVGPEVSDPFAKALLAAGGANRIETAAQLGPAVGAMLSPEVSAKAALNAWTLATEGAEATAALAEAILALLAAKEA